ncbi:MAG: hypothetical protein KKF52_03320 [Nanoarchaeota archaeon]|nr:hypothetical protein [Nanoarchaeota archaeon]MBU4242237.1 hypothetical protein [Nanoarchaeota archaeon]MBU4351817.1 hypothetical protein [Nanoarchaeota archaeon]
MLTIEEVVELYEKEGLVIIFKQINKKFGPKTLAGEYNTENNLNNSTKPPEIIIYQKMIENQKDLEITLLHEFIHARNDLILELDKENDTEVEKEAVETYKKSPEVIEFIKDFYCLKKLNFNP